MIRPALPGFLLRSTKGQKQKNRPWAVTTLLLIVLLLLGFFTTSNMVPGAGLEPAQP